MFVRLGRQHKRPVLQQQLQTAVAARGAAVVQRSDAIDGGGVHLERNHSRVHPMRSHLLAEISLVGCEWSSTYIGSGVDQRSHTGNVSRQAGLMEGGHMINGTNVSGVTLATTTQSFDEFVSVRTGAHECGCRQHLGQQGAQCKQSTLRSSFMERRPISP